VAGLVRASHYVLTHGSRGSLTTTLIRRPPEPTVPTTGARVIQLHIWLQIVHRLNVLSAVLVLLTNRKDYKVTAVYCLGAHTIRHQKLSQSTLSWRSWRFQRSWRFWIPCSKLEAPRSMYSLSGYCDPSLNIINYHNLCNCVEGSLCLAKSWGPVLYKTALACFALTTNTSSRHKWYAYVAIENIISVSQWLI